MAPSCSSRFQRVFKSPFHQRQKHQAITSVSSTVATSISSPSSDAVDNELSNLLRHGYSAHDPPAFAPAVIVESQRSSWPSDDQIGGPGVRFIGVERCRTANETVESNLDETSTVLMIDDPLIANYLSFTASMCHTFDLATDHDESYLSSINSPPSHSAHQKGSDQSNIKNNQSAILQEPSKSSLSSTSHGVRLTAGGQLILRRQTNKPQHRKQHRHEGYVSRSSTDDDDNHRPFYIADSRWVL